MAAFSKAPTLKRINEVKANNVAPEFSNTTYEASGGGTYGEWSNQKLKFTQGASFIKEKNKMKKRNSHASGGFQAGAVNSTKLY